MVVEKSWRRCLLCDAPFTGRAFVCRSCADRYRGVPVPPNVLRQFYERVDQVYPEWANTYGNYNPPEALIRFMELQDREARVLEIGAGGGFLLEDLWSRGFRHLIGSDVTSTSLVEMRVRNARITVVGADAESLPFQNRAFDFVISSDLIEHLTRVNSHLSEVHRVLVPGGRYLFKTPNRLLAQAYYQARGLYDHHIWHPSMFTPGEIRNLLRGYGFDVELLPNPRLTYAQLRKIPMEALRAVGKRVPVNRLPAWVRPHLEVIAVRRW